MIEQKIFVTTEMKTSDCNELFSDSRINGEIPEYSPSADHGMAPIVELEGDNKIIFRTQNSEQYKHLYFCQITEGGIAEQDAKSFEVKFGSKIGSNYNSEISNQDELILELTKKDGIDLNIAEQPSYYLGKTENGDYLTIIFYRYLCLFGRTRSYSGKRSIKSVLRSACRPHSSRS